MAFFKRVAIGAFGAFLVSEAAATQPTFGKNYEGSILQNWILAQGNSAPASGGTMELNLDTPELKVKEEPATGYSAGPISNLNFGGALDMRLYLPRIGGPTEEHMGFANFDIHVSELFLTTNIGDHISVLAEQLLVTSPMGSTIGQDHGFVYAIFSNLPGLPDDLAIKVGRLRFRFGIDAKLDSPANPLKSPVYKTLGTITDKGIEFSGLLGDVEWSLAVANGVDAVDAPVTTAEGETAMVMMERKNGSKPVIARLAWDATDWMSVGVSGFTGKTYPVLSHPGFGMMDMIFGARTDTTRFIYKNRGAVDAKFRLGSKVDLSAEYAFGNDRDGGQSYNVWSAYGRLDYRIVPQKWSTQLQYEYFTDGRSMAHAGGGVGTIGAGVTYSVSDQVWIRGAWLMGDRDTPDYMGVVQTMMSF